MFTCSILRHLLAFSNNFSEGCLLILYKSKQKLRLSIPELKVRLRIWTDPSDEECREEGTRPPERKSQVYYLADWNADYSWTFGRNVAMAPAVCFSTVTKHARQRRKGNCSDVCPELCVFAVCRICVYAARQSHARAFEHEQACTHVQTRADEWRRSREYREITTTLYYHFARN